MNTNEIEPDTYKILNVNAINFVQAFGKPTTSQKEDHQLSISIKEDYQ